MSRMSKLRAIVGGFRRSTKCSVRSGKARLVLLLLGPKWEKPLSLRTKLLTWLLRRMLQCCGLIMSRLEVRSSLVVIKPSLELRQGSFTVIDGNTKLNLSQRLGAEFYFMTMLT